MDLPLGTVTFLFTDIEGSTRLWEQSPEEMRLALARHDAILRESIQSHGGAVFKTVGDAFYAAFPTAPDALRATLAAQHALIGEAWPAPVTIRVRMALHTGTAQHRDNDYFGPSLNRVARLLSAGHGSQILVSAATYELVRDHLPEGVGIVDMGSHRLEHLERPEQVFRVTQAGLPDMFPPLRTKNEAPHNLPPQLTSFIGREQVVREVKDLLGATRLLTLTGMGGCGKTRLSLRVASDLLGSYADGGAWFVELAPLNDPNLIPQTIAAVLGLREGREQSPQERVIQFLRNRRLLLILDNCEHLVDACVHLADTLLRSCPQLTILATSRAPLGGPGEVTYRVPPLSLPDLRHLPPLESLTQYEAVRLFIDRARLAQPSFTVTCDNAPAVAAVCYGLDGVPLAIELAAARVRALSVEQINERLDQRFRLLTGGSRTALPRQQTLMALIDWSYDLLSDEERVLLSRLAVFAGGWTLEAAESICGFGTIESWEILDLLIALADKSLLLMDEQGGEARYRMLEMVRQYAAEKLHVRGEVAEQIRRRHRDWFLELAEKAESRLNGPEQQRWLERLELEHGNLRAALATCASEASTEAAEAGLALAGALGRFWLMRGHLTEGRDRLRSALERAEAQGRTPYRARALHVKAMIARTQGDYAAARKIQEEALSIWSEAEDRQGMAYSLNSLGLIAYGLSDLDDARSLFERTITINSELGQRLGVAYPLNNLGLIAYAQGDLDAAQTHHEEALAIREELGDSRGIAISLNGLGRVAGARGDYAGARILHEKSLAIWSELGDQAGSGITVELLAVALLALGETQKAVRLWAAADALQESITYTVPPIERAELDQHIAKARETLGETAFHILWEEGHHLEWSEAVEYAFGKNGIVEKHSALLPAATLRIV